MSSHCRIVLEEGLSKDTCYDFRKVRSYVMCRAWDTMKKEGITFRDAVKRAWEETTGVCAREVK